MSFAENLLIESLNLILHPNEERLRNVRPDFLCNPYTNCNLELDIFLPRLQLGIEVQGPHHYTDEEQIVRDAIKRVLCAKADVHLLEISIFEVRPVYIRAKLLDYSHTHQKYVNVQERDDTKWNALDRKITQYKKQILGKFGDSDNYTTPTARTRREEHVKQNYELSKCLYVVVNDGEKSFRAQPVKWSRSTKITVRPLGSGNDALLKISRARIDKIV